MGMPSYLVGGMPSYLDDEIPNLWKIIQMFETTNHPFIFHYQMVTHHEISIKSPFISLLNHHNPNVPNHHPVDNHY